MALSKAQLAARDGKLTASFASPLCAGNETVILNRWKELIGDPSYSPDTFDDNWPVQFGAFVEPFALDWHERKTHHELTRRGEVVTHPTRPHVCATIDSYRAHDNTVIDCKVSNEFHDLDALLRYHSPQLLVQMECTGAVYSALLVVHGGGEPQELQAHFSEAWAAQVWQTLDAFWRCVETLTPPVAIPLPPPPPEKWRKIDLDAPEGGQHNWAAEMRELAGRWAASIAAAKDNAEAATQIKALMPTDCGYLATGIVEVKRNRARSLSIKTREGKGG
jgi:hypothetical protein